MTGNSKEEVLCMKELKIANFKRTVKCTQHMQLCTYICTCIRTISLIKDLYINCVCLLKYLRVSHDFRHEHGNIMYTRM